MKNFNLSVGFVIFFMCVSTSPSVARPPFFQKIKLFFNGAHQVNPLQPGDTAVIFSAYVTATFLWFFGGQDIPKQITK